MPARPPGLRPASRALPCLAAAAALAAACAPAAGLRFSAPDLAGRLPPSVAVLPFDNQSVNIDAPGLVRKAVEDDLRGRGWSVADPAGVDAALKGLGVTDGGQLPALDPKKLAAAVGAPGLLFGTIEEFADMNVGFARRRVVRLSLRLVEASTGQRLWEAVGQGETEQVALNKKAAERAFVVGLAQKELEDALGSPLKLETRAAVQKALSYLPRRSS